MEPAREPERIGEFLPAVIRELAEGVSPAVAWRYQEIADRFEYPNEEEKLAA